MIIERQAAGATVLIDPYRRTMITLDPVGEEIWRALDGARPVSGVIALLKEHFDADEETLAKDAAAFLRDLEKREIVRSCSAR